MKGGKTSRRLWMKLENEHETKKKNLLRLSSGLSRD